jgi:hypothetical protein
MPKVILHNLSMPYRQFAPGTFDFDQLGVLFAQPEDVVVTRTPLPTAFLSYLGRSLFPVSAKMFLHPQVPLSEEPFSVFRDEDLARRIRSRTGSHPERWKFDCFAPTQHEYALAASLGIPLNGTANQYQTFGTKSVFRRLSRAAGLPLPRGYGGIEHPLYGIGAALRLFVAGFSEVIIKHDEGVAGLSTRIVNRKQFTALLREGGKLFDFQKGITPVSSRAFVVEGWHRDVRFSPSVQLFVHRKGNVSVLSTHVQLFQPNRVTYRGCLSHHWIPEHIRDRLEREALRFGEELSRHGFFGHLGLNAIVLESGDILWVEANPRRVISSYAHQLAHRASASGEPPHYLSLEIQAAPGPGETADQIFDRFKPLLFSRRTGSGIIPYSFNILHSTGKIRVLFLGRSQDEIEDLFFLFSTAASR